jgi:hypothetical protein
MVSEGLTGNFAPEGSLGGCEALMRIPQTPGGHHDRAGPGMTACTERSEGQKGMPKEGTV